MDVLSTFTEEKTVFAFVDVRGLKKLSDENNIEVILSVADFTKGEFVEVPILREKITPRNIEALMDRNGGLCQDAKQVCKYIKKKVAKLLVNYACCGTTQITLKHCVLGWTWRDGEEVFCHDSIYTKNATIKSDYYGEYNISPKGSLAAIKSLFSECIECNTPMQAVMCLATAATVLPYANRHWGVTIYNPINHFMGDSTTGKSTAAVLFASFCGSPIGTDGFCLSFLGTSNALVKEIGENHGSAVAIDEFSSTMSKADWTDFVYTLANGRGKARCKAGGTKIQEIEQFETVFLTTGEISILNKCNKNEGIRARLLEFQIESWTRSAKEADRIKDVVKKNYGLIAPLIANGLLRSGTYWEKRFAKWRKKVKDRIEAENLLLGIGDRLSDFVALYMVSCEILCRILNICMNIESVFDFFYTHIIFKNAEDRNLGLRAYDAIMSYFVKNRDKYPDFIEFYEDEATVLADEQEGFVVRGNRKHIVGDTVYTDYVFFFPEVLEEALRRRGFADPKVALKAVQKEKLLRAKDNNRIYLEKKVNGVVMKVYAVWVEADC